MIQFNNNLEYSKEELSRKIISLENEKKILSENLNETKRNIEMLR